MKTKHTPGPWRIIRCDNGDLTVSYSDGELRSHVATCHDIALAPEHGNLLANARLIAAAPDLLAALCTLVDATNTRSLAYDDAVAAIAKARGNA